MSTDDSSAHELSQAKPPQRTTGGHMRWTPPTVEELQRLLPAYEIISVLGAGGMGAVYRAKQRSLDRPVAIKILPLNADDEDGSFAQRFINEARTMARMSHPGIVSVFDFGETSEGQLFIVMEFIDGTDVSKMIHSQGKLPAEYALAITAHVCDALAYAHAHGIIHRDIKPANILINMDGQVKVADFGLAKASDAGHGLTKTNMAMGTPDFVAPEVLMGGVPVDGRADLYAVGVMLYNMLTGEIPRGLFMMPGIRSGGQTDPRFDKIIAKSMEMDRDMRYQTATDIRRDLDVIISTPQIQSGGAPSAAIPRLPQKPVSRPTQPQSGPRTAPTPITNTKPQDRPPRSTLGPVLGIAATLVIAAGLFFFFKGPAGSPPTSVRETKASTSSIVPESPKPKALPASPPRVTNSKPKPNPPPSSTLPPAVALQTLDLLALTDPVKDRINTSYSLKNVWLRQGAALVFQSDGKAGKLAAPVAFDCSDYEIELRAEKLSGNDRIHMDIPLGKNRIVPIVLNSQGRKVIHEREGKPWPQAAAIVHVTVRVRRSEDGVSDHVVIKRNDKDELLADWTGSLDQIARKGEPHPDFSNEPVASVFLMKDPYTVSIWTLRVFAGEAKVLRDPNGPTKEPAPLAHAPSVPMTSPSPAPSPASVIAAPQGDAVSERLADLEKQFLTAYERDADAGYKASLTALNASYSTALDRAQAAATKAGHLDEVIALRDEKLRLTSGQGLPPADLENLNPTLKTMRATYRQTVAKFESDRDKKAAPLYSFYDQALARYESELTQKQKLDDAQRVKARRGEITSKKSDPPPAPEAAPVSSPKPIVNAPKAAAPTPTGRSRWADAAQWVLSVGGQLQLEKGGQHLRADRLSELPSGKFDIIDITINANPKSAAIKDEDFNRLSGLKMRKLVLNNIKVTDAAFAFLPTTPELEVLNLSQVPVTDSLMVHLAPLHNLLQLRVNSARKFTGVGLDRLTCLPVLKELTISDTSLNDSGAKALADARNLETLFIENCGVGDEGLSGLGVLTKLTQLSLIGCKNFKGSAISNWEKMTALKSLNLSTSKKLQPEALAVIAALNHLSSIDLSDSPVISDESLKELAPLVKIKRLTLDRDHITGDGFANLTGLSELRYLQLHDVHLTSTGLSAMVSAFPQLEEVRLSGSLQLSADDFLIIANLKNLKQISLTLPTLNDEALGTIASIPTLESISVDGASITAAGLVRLKLLKYLNKLIITKCKGIDDSAIPALKELKALKDLFIKGASITPDGARALQKAMPRCKVYGD